MAERDEYNHPVNQDIRAICLVPDENATSDPWFRVGENGVTRIEACVKGGEYCNIPYVRVWAEEIALAEFCQHHIFAVYFTAPEDRP